MIRIKRSDNSDDRESELTGILGQLSISGFIVLGPLQAQY
jgi:hypothetical protein